MHKLAQSLYRERRLIIFIIITLILYSFFIIERPYEDDESLYIRSGQAILSGDLNPFEIIYKGHYSNPFQYIMGTPLVPLIYGLSYNVGGILLSRSVSLFFILLSIVVVSRIVKKAGGNLNVTLLLIVFSGSTILLGSNSLLDSVAVFFFVSCIYFLIEKKTLFAGIFSGISVISKFVLLVPMGFVFIFLLIKRRWLKFLVGNAIIFLPLILTYVHLIPVILNFIFEIHLAGSFNHEVGNFLSVLIVYFPAASLIACLGFGSRYVKKYRILFIPVISVLLLHILTLNYNSLIRHLPYAEFPAAILSGLILKGVKGKRAWLVYLFLTFYVIASLGFSAVEMYNYPSYNSIEKDVSNLDGRILALNLNSLMLIKDLPYDSTAKNVFSYYYFNYDDTLDSKIEEYENALKDGYFDYALISSYPTKIFGRFDLIEDLVREYYCPVSVSDKPNGIDIYEKCGKGNQS